VEHKGILIGFKKTKLALSSFHAVAVAYRKREKTDCSSHEKASNITGKTETGIKLKLNVLL